MTTEPEETEAEPSKRLTPADWVQVVVLWESGTITLQGLSDRFGISKPSLSIGLTKRGAVKGRRSAEFAKTTEEALKSESQRHAEKIKAFRNTYHTYGDYIMQSAVVELQALRKKPREERTREENARIFTSIKYTAEVFAHCRDQKFHLFDLYNEHDQEGDLPEIGVAEYTPEEIDNIKRRFDTVPVFEEDDDILKEAHEAVASMEEAEAL